jgi:hypothetical protein
MVVAISTGYSIEYIKSLPITQFRNAYQYCLKYTAFELSGEFEMQSESEIYEEAKEELLELHGIKE